MKRATNITHWAVGTIGISIHALVKRATIKCAGMSKGAKISIHALVKRATLLRQLDTLSLSISIHALVKRATNLRYIIWLH